MHRKNISYQSGLNNRKVKSWKQGYIIFMKRVKFQPPPQIKCKAVPFKNNNNSNNKINNNTIQTPINNKNNIQQQQTLTVIGPSIFYSRRSWVNKLEEKLWVKDKQ